jgi:putative peptide zinc metalloprotease protein
VVLSVLGARIFFNFNPLLKLDGYYLLSDWKEIPNLQQRGWDRVKGHLRRLLWGAPRPAPDPRGRFLTAYGLASWLFSLVFLGLMLFALFRFLWACWGLAALAVVGPLGFASLRAVLGGLGGGEVRRMILIRRKRVLLWVLFLAGILSALFGIRAEDRVSGPFQVRPAVRAELRAPMAGFLSEVWFDEGDRVSPDAPVARLEIPDLESRIAQKRAEAREAEAKLRLLEAGPRAEEVLEQRRRVERAGDWRDLAHHDLERARKSYAEELARLDEQIRQATAEMRFAQETFERSRQLQVRGVVSDELRQEAGKKLEVCRAQAEAAGAQKRSLLALGTREAEAELARRTKELADAEGTLVLLEAGARYEEVEAARAHLARAEEEARYLEGLREKLDVCSPVGGLVTTPRLKERVGQYVREGELICLVEEPEALEAEIVLDEQDVARVRTDQPVELKARALPFRTFGARVGRVAPSAARPEPSQPQSGAAAPRADVPGTVSVYCRLEGPGPDVRPGMTGHARIYAGQRPLGEIFLDRTLRVLRTEFWW